MGSSDGMCERVWLSGDFRACRAACRISRKTRCRLLCVFRNIYRTFRSSLELRAGIGRYIRHRTWDSPTFDIFGSKLLRYVKCRDVPCTMSNVLLNSVTPNPVVEKNPTPGLRVIRVRVCNRTPIERAEADSSRWIRFVRA